MARLEAPDRAIRTAAWVWLPARCLVTLAVLVAPAPAARAEPAAAAALAKRVAADRVVARWHSSATGGAARPQFILARELAFEARVEALAEGYAGSGGFADKHVRSALQRHVTETLLAALPVDRPPDPTRIAEHAHAAKLMAEQRVGGPTNLVDAARTEGLDPSELDALWRRQARASIYLDRMVAPMLEPSEADLREAFERSEARGSGRSFHELRVELRRTVVAARLAQALARYYRNAQTRLVIQLLRAPEARPPAQAAGTASRRPRP